MIDITHKSRTLRSATAKTTVICPQETADHLREINYTTAKGNIFEISKAAGLLALKKVPDLLPFCHPIAVHHAKITLELVGNVIEITVFAQCIDRTGIEVEAISAASIVALNVFDMLKPISTDVYIGEARVTGKRGGKNDFGSKTGDRNAAIVVCSDSVSAGKKQDSAGLAARELLSDYYTISSYQIIPDIESTIAETTQSLVAENDFVVLVGGTGLGPRDVTIEAVRPLLQREIPGIAEEIRRYGMERTPYASLSRSIVGQIDQSIVACLPGSTAGARESLQAILPWSLHIFDVFDKSYRH